MNSMRRQKDITLKDELPRLVGAHYANEEAESKQKYAQLWMGLVVKVKSDAVKNNNA